MPSCSAAITFHASGPDIARVSAIAPTSSACSCDRNRLLRHLAYPWAVLGTRRLNFRIVICCQAFSWHVGCGSCKTASSGG